MKNKKKILIVGGSSGLGIYLTKLYKKNKYEVTILARNLNKKLDKSIKQLSCDVTNLNEIKNVLSKFLFSVYLILF